MRLFGEGDKGGEVKWAKKVAAFLIVGMAAELL